MTRKIGIIGLGHVGATLAHSMILKHTCDHLVLIDTNEKKVKADALDFCDTVANTGYPVHITVNDYAALKDADVVVSTLGNIELQANNTDDRFAELPFTSKQVVQVARDLKASGFSGVLLVVTNPVDAVTQLYQQYTGLPKEQVIGTGTLLDTARMKRAVADRLQVSPASVSGYNLGEHGNSQFVAWSQVRVKGHAITDLFSQEELDAINYESLRGGHTVFFGKFYTNFGIAAAAQRLAEAVINDSHEEMPVSNYRPEYGTYLGYPAIVGRKGIIERLDLHLTEEEKDIYEEIKENKEKALIKNIDRYKLILTNILIAITSIIYLWLVVGLGNSLNTITFLSNMKTLIIIEIIAVVVMFEIANKRESKTLFLHSIESFIMTSFTMILYGLFGRENQNIRFFVLGMVAIIYYVVKSLIIKFKKV